MQQGIENAAGIAGGKQRAGFDGDEDEPENRGDPGLENIVAIGVQEGDVPEGFEFPLLAKDARSGAPNFFLDPRRGLLDTIIGGLAGDHYVVDVALAESCAADADEARFLQEFGDGGATAVSHAGTQSADHLMNDHGD